MQFDPDAFLAEADAPAFDPDAFLAEPDPQPAAAPAPAFDPDAFLAEPEPPKGGTTNAPTPAFTGQRFDVQSAGDLARQQPQGFIGNRVDDIARGIQQGRAGLAATIGTEAEMIRRNNERIKSEYPHYAAFLEQNDMAGARAEAERRAQAEVDKMLPKADAAARGRALNWQRQIENMRINGWITARDRAEAAAPFAAAGVETAGEFATKAAAIPKTEDRLAFDAAPDVAGKLRAVARNPVGVIGSIVAESLGQSAPAVAGSAAGALVGGPAGAAVGAAAGGAATDYTATILGELQSAGVDFTKPDEAAARLQSDPELLNRVRATAAARQIPMAAVNAVTGALGGRFVTGAAGQGGRAMAGAIGAEMAVGSVGEAAGEAAAQVASGQPLNPGEILAEGLGGLGGQVGEVAGALARASAAPQADSGQIIRLPPITPAYIAQQRALSNAGAAPGGVSPAPDTPTAGSLEGPVPAPSQPAAPAAGGFDPDAFLAEVNATVPAPQPPAPQLGDPNAFDPDKFLEQVNQADRDPMAGTGFDPSQVRTQEVPLADITLSKDVPNFKEDSRSDTGEVKGQELKGRYVRLGTPPIVVWERTDGRKEVITGRHRLGLARRAGEASIPAQIVREADGFTRDMALIFDAESNIRDGQGSTRDYAHYFRNAGITRLEAESRGLVQRAKGADGAALGFDATDDLYTLYRNRKLSEPKTVAIARAAPGDATMQQLAAAQALQDASLTADDLGNLVRAVQEVARTSNRAAQLDLFGRDDTAMKEMVATARAASRIQGRIREKITTIRQGKKLSEGDRAALARELGIQVTAADLDTTLATLEAEAQAWNNWQTTPERVRAARQEAKLAVQPGPTSPAAPANVSSSPANVGSSSSNLAPSSGSSSPNLPPPPAVAATESSITEQMAKTQMDQNNPNLSNEERLAAARRFLELKQQAAAAAPVPSAATPPAPAVPSAGVAPDGQQQLIGQDEGGFTLTGEVAKPPPVDPAKAAKEAEEAQRRFREANSDSLFAPINAIPRDFDPNPAPLARFGKDASTGQPVGTGDIIRFIEGAFDVPIRTGRLTTPAEGYYMPFRESIRLRQANTVPVAFHELGHYLHNVIFPGNPNQDARGSLADELSSFGGTFDTELMPLGARTSMPSYPPEMVRAEGVAEFLRVYMDDRANALARAPRFTAHFETETGKIPELSAALETARDMVQRWKNQSPEERIDGQIRSSRDKYQTRSPREFIHGMYTAWADQTHPLKRTLAEIERLGGNPTEAKAIAGMVDNYIGGWRGKVEDALHTNSTDINGRVIGPGLRQILEQVKVAAPAAKLSPGGTAIKAFSRYLAAKHAQVDLHPRGIQTGLNQADVDAVVTKWDPHFRPLAQQLIQWQRQQRDLLVQAEVIDAAAAQAMDAKHMWYVPFHRFYETVSGRAGVSGGQGFVNTGRGIARMKGGRREIIDPLESVIKNAYVFRDIAERNLIAQRITDFFLTTRGGGRIGDQVKGIMRPVDVKASELVQMLQDAGADQVTVANVKALGEGGQIWRAIDGVRPRDGIYRVWRKGKEQYYQVDDPALYRALVLADQTDAEILSRFPFLKAVNWFTRLKRAGATLSPDFIFRNPIRDQLTAAIYAKDGSYTPFVDMFRGMFHVLRKDGLYNEWVRSGGRYAHMVGADKTDLQEALQDVVKDQTARRAFLDAMNPLNIIQTLQQVSTILEESTRVQYFANRRAAGDTTTEAANASKEITLNFSRHGTSGKLINMLSAFFNAGIQDTVRVWKAHADPKAAPGVMMRGFLYITVPSLLAWAAKEYGEEEDRKILDGLPEWRKNLAWNFRLGGRTWTIPKPFLLGQVYGSSVERALDYMQGRDPNALRAWFDRTLSMMPAGGPGRKEGLYIPEGLMPDIARLAMEGASNYSTFRQGPIVPSRVQNLPKAEQYDARTSQAGRKLGELFNMSPIMVDHLIANTFAGLGRMGNDTIDFIVAQTHAKEDAAPPAKPLIEQVPGLRAFVVPELSSQRQVDELYRGIRNAEKLMRSASTKTKEDKVWIEKHGKDYVHYVQRMPVLRRLADTLGDINKAQRQVIEDKTLTPEDKRARLVQLNQYRSRLAERAIEENLILPIDRYKER